MTPAARLRAAAARLREVAEGATPGPWVNSDGLVCAPDGQVIPAGGTYYYGPKSADPACAAVMSPPVALALAAWLEDEASRHAPVPVEGVTNWAGEQVSGLRWTTPVPDNALALADAVLGDREPATS